MGKGVMNNYLKIKKVFKRRGLIVLLILLFQSMLVLGQSNIEKRQIIIDSETNTIEKLFAKIKNDLGIEIGYSSNEIDVSRKINIPSGNTELGKIMEEIFPEDTFRILWKNDKVLIKKIRRDSGNANQIFGYVIDAESGEKLLGATIYDSNSQTGVSTNNYGYFSLATFGENADLTIRYLGYQNQEIKIEHTKDTLVNITLQPIDQFLEDVVITDDRLAEKVVSTESGVVEIPIERIKALPALAGEIDVLKNIQQLPGVQMVGEGTSAYYVRGGNYDQNLILLDEAPVYNPSHALGFFSVFNGDAIKDLTFYKNHIPVKYGGKLSSVLDVRMKEGNKKKYHVSGGLGLISSRLSVEGPIAKDRASFLVTGRRTYADFIWRTISNDEATKNTSIYFYDLNAKMNYKIGEKDQLFVSGFFGRDVNEIEVQQYGIIWDNKTLTMRWNHLYSSKLFSNASLIYSKYNYDIGLNDFADGVTWESFIEDYTAKMDFDWFANASNHVRFGFSSTFHNIAPGKVSEAGYEDLNMSDADALEHVLYIEDRINISEKLNIEVGLRGTAFQNIGESTLYHYNDDYIANDSVYYPKGDIYNTFFALDPRVSASYALNPQSSLKFSYDHTSQFIHLLQNNLIPFSSFDQWLISNPNVAPQYANHFNFGYYRYLGGPGIGLSADVFYKQMLNQIDAADHAQLLLNKYLEGDVREGKGHAYGFEVSLEKSKGDVQGILGYSFLRAQRTIRDINNGKIYNAPFDKPHTIQAALTWNASRRIDVGMNWIFSSGGPITLPSETFYYNGKSVPVYNGRNQYRMPDYHRLDLSLTLKRKKTQNVKNHSTWVFALYNTYFRKNPSAVFSSQKLDLDYIDIIDPTVQEIYKTWLFSIVPSVTYNFNF